MTNTNYSDLKLFLNPDPLSDKIVLHHRKFIFQQYIDTALLLWPWEFLLELEKLLVLVLVSVKTMLQGNKFLYIDTVLLFYIYTNYIKH